MKGVVSCAKQVCMVPVKPGLNELTAQLPLCYFKNRFFETGNVHFQPYRSAVLKWYENVCV